jgi:hypothetical protein
LQWIGLCDIILIGSNEKNEFAEAGKKIWIECRREIKDLIVLLQKRKT